MPKVSVIVLTKNRAVLLKQALESVLDQTETDIEILVVNDGSTDETDSVLELFEKNIQSGHINNLHIQTIRHGESRGITLSRQEALEKARGELVAFLDDDDIWCDPEKLSKQIAWFKENKKGVLVGGGMQVIHGAEFSISNTQEKRDVKFRPEKDVVIRNTMLFRNNFFTSTVMFRRDKALEAGGFKVLGVDLAEDYDLWLRLGNRGEMGNIQEVFTLYRSPSYNKEKLVQFLKKQADLISEHGSNYPYFWVAYLFLKLRVLFNTL